MALTQSRRPEHRRATLRFWREQRAEAALRERVLVPAEECERLERALQRAVAAHRQREDERIQEVPRTGAPHRYPRIRPPSRDPRPHRALPADGGRDPGGRAAAAGDGAGGAGGR